MDDDSKPGGAGTGTGTGTGAGTGGQPRDPYDFTADSVSPIASPVPASYDSRPGEDGARRYIAFSLIGILAVIIYEIFFMLHLGRIKVDEVKEFGVILGPIITLVSAATGFYYGTKSSKDRNIDCGSGVKNHREVVPLS
ncbi:hypothetical protein ABNQ38_21750 [Azospirillum sp. A29]|uniref:hypothetical protein n=1 Tax=Azospirillum sp. A29 TaxID=3160606 RepID=UPI003672E194